MTEVTRKNFEALFPEIVEKIENSTFICLDAEYTGIYSEAIECANTLFDSASQRYQKIKSNASKFTSCQFGVAIFKKEKDANVYNVDAYTFYLFPVAFDAFAKRELLVCQVSCINFLARHKFDFNKFMTEGIPFLNSEKAEGLRNFLRANPHVLHTSEHIDEDYFPRKYHTLTDENVQHLINGLAGFSKVIHVISKSKKPVIGHNCLIDLLLTHQLFWSDLPASYEDFKKSIHEIFPLIYDTKRLAHEVHNLRRENDPGDFLLTDTNLFALYTNTYSVFELNMPLVEVRGETMKYKQALMDGRAKNLETLSNGDCHNAGFDALVTGCVFLNLSYMACRPSPVPDFRRGLPPTFSELIAKTECWSNRVNMARAIISHIVSDLNLAGSDPKPHRPNWIVVRSVEGKFIDPIKLKLNLVKYGDLEIERHSDTEVLVACGGVGCSRRVWKDLANKGYILTEKTVSSEATAEFKWLITFGVLAGSIFTIFLYRRLK